MIRKLALTLTAILAMATTTVEENIESTFVPINSSVVIPGLEHVVEPTTDYYKLIWQQNDVDRTYSLTYVYDDFLTHYLTKVHKDPTDEISVSSIYDEDNKLEGIFVFAYPGGAQVNIPYAGKYFDLSNGADEITMTRLKYPVQTHYELWKADNE